MDPTTWYLTHAVDIPHWFTPRSLGIKHGPYLTLEMILRCTRYGVCSVSAETIAGRLGYDPKAVGIHIKLLDVRGYIETETRTDASSKYIYPKLLPMLRAAAANQAKLPITLNQDSGAHLWEVPVRQQIRTQIERKLQKIDELKLARIRTEDALAALLDHNKFRAEDDLEQLYFALQDAHLLGTRDAAMRARGRGNDPAWSDAVRRQCAEAHAAIFDRNRRNQPNQPGEVFV